MVGSVVVVVDQPGLQRPVEQRDVVDAAAVEVWPVELAQHGSMEPLADRVVVRGPGRDPVVDQPELTGPCLNALPTNSGPLSLSTPGRAMPCLRSALVRWSRNEAATLAVSCPRERQLRFTVWLRHAGEFDGSMVGPDLVHLDRWLASGIRKWV